MLKITSPSRYECLETAQPPHCSGILKWLNGHREFRADNATSNLILSPHENRWRLLTSVNWLLLKLYLLA